MGALALVAAGSLASAAPAAADSTKCAFYGTGIKGLVRNGSFCGTITGTGTTVNRVLGNFGTTIPGRDVVCNPSIKIDVYDRWGNWLTWRQGAQKLGCFYGTYNSVPTMGVYQSFPAAKYGSIRVTLQSSGMPVAETWHGVGG